MIEYRKIEGEEENSYWRQLFLDGTPISRKKATVHVDNDSERGVHYNISTRDYDTSLQICRYALSDFLQLGYLSLDFKLEWSEILEILMLLRKKDQTRFTLAFEFTDISAWKRPYSLSRYYKELRRAAKAPSATKVYMGLQDENSGAESGFNIQFTPISSDLPILSEISRCANHILEWHREAVGMIDPTAKFPSDRKLFAKECPECHSIYTDAEITFCLRDGSPLKSKPYEETLVIPSAKNIHDATTQKEIFPKLDSSSLSILGLFALYICYLSYTKKIEFNLLHLWSEVEPHEPSYGQGFIAALKTVGLIDYRITAVDTLLITSIDEQFELSISNEVQKRKQHGSKSPFVTQRLQEIIPIIEKYFEQPSNDMQDGKQ